ncbi:MAG: AmmeMemoRadiSam system radical SAM enzyme [Calditrichaceae bacterium]
MKNIRSNNAERYIDRLPDNFEYSIGRRHFLKTGAILGWASLCPALMANNKLYASTGNEDERFIREARYYEKLDHKKIRCKLCPRECVIDDRERGYCGVRENRDGVYYTLVYSRPCTYHIDPIEKKPLFHFYPGSIAFSIATAGCNLNCKFCQNWQISQVTPEQVRSIYMSPGDVAQAAAQNKCLSIAYTYNEPTIFYEYMYDTAIKGHANDVKSVVITAGYIAKEPLETLCGRVDAIKVDLKAFSEKYYQDVVKGELKPVLDSLVTMQKMDVWTEIVYLVVPTMNDSDLELKKLSKWIKANLGPDVPVHFTRFHPQYILKNLPPTPLETLERAKAIADTEGLNYVYIGNVPGHEAENTYCPKCGELLIKRIGFTIAENHIESGECRFCSNKIPGMF